MQWVAVDIIGAAFSAIIPKWKGEGGREGERRLGNLLLISYWYSIQYSCRFKGLLRLFYSTACCEYAYNT